MHPYPPDAALYSICHLKSKLLRNYCWDLSLVGQLTPLSCRAIGVGRSNIWKRFDATGICRLCSNLFLMPLEAEDLVFSSRSLEPPLMTLLRQILSGLHAALDTAALARQEILSYSISAHRKCFFPHLLPLYCLN